MSFLIAAFYGLLSLTVGGPAQVPGLHASIPSVNATTRQVRISFDGNYGHPY
jgi:hypothetical protein